MSNKKFNALTDRIEGLCRSRDLHYKQAQRFDRRVQPLVKRAAEMLRQEDVVRMREVL